MKQSREYMREKKKRFYCEENASEVDIYRSHLLLVFVVIFLPKLRYTKLRVNANRYKIVSHYYYRLGNRAVAERKGVTSRGKKKEKNYNSTAS